MVRIKLSPRISIALTNRKQFNSNTAPFKHLTLLRGLFPFLAIIFSLLSSVRGLKGWTERGGEGWKKEEPTKEPSKDQLQDVPS